MILYNREEFQVVNKEAICTHLNNRKPIPLTAARRTSSLTSETFFSMGRKREILTLYVECVAILWIGVSI